MAADAKRAHDLGDCVAWPRQTIAVAQVLAHWRIKPPARCSIRVFAQEKPESGVADRSGRNDPIADLGAAALDHGVVRHGSERRDRDRDWPGSPIRIAAEQWAFILLGVGAKAAREGGEPVVTDIGGQRERQQEPERFGAFGGEIGEVHPQCLAGDAVGRVIREEMHIAHDRIGLEHEIAAGRRHQNGRIVEEAERTRLFCERAEIASDQAIFGGFVAHPAACSNSATRSWRAI